MQMFLTDVGILESAIQIDGQRSYNISQGMLGAYLKTVYEFHAFLLMFQLKFHLYTPVYYGQL